MIPIEWATVQLYENYTDYLLPILRLNTAHSRSRIAHYLLTITP
ncbi:hypothetical protein PL9631_710005 [Planktothrix paucivesiculata PCC 9631]|uniref:Uncharacterized protein n=1 Tax=Planktothrix paucivesiculata PCC 9631 TaxID=671071 RepID=A0A7Z9C152_9CYAN|nr:hypothetical protein PL9631_710005 [Planktothrix paucivesiculata PCC 9631]